ncbi:hypothetical protein T12_3133 [Trichinella patagoniensis]|uniref:Uncharacterized protein n=1 Tax=Trichinella patagoniensis TaxID=990121 RepID=A0A0V0YPN0_9BILA|nr:hypothetical protein T12_3133 [Trichinella patagoniensis]
MEEFGEDIKLILHSTESPDLSYLYHFIQQYKV